MIDRGADISYLSQYPHEAETLFAPLTGLEVQSTGVEGTVLIVGVGLSVNLTALTIDQVLSKRKRIVEGAAEGAVLEARAKMLASDVPELADQAEESVLAVTKGGLLSREAAWFNDDINLSWAVQTVVDVKACVLEVLGGAERCMTTDRFVTLCCEKGCNAARLVATVPVWLSLLPVVTLCVRSSRCRASTA